MHNRKIIHKMKNAINKWEFEVDIKLDTIFIRENNPNNVSVCTINMPIMNKRTEEVAKFQLRNAYLISKVPEMVDWFTEILSCVNGLRRGAMSESEFIDVVEQLKPVILEIPNQMYNIATEGKCNAQDNTYVASDMLMDKKDIEKENKIMYFISSHTHMNEFTWPCLPDPAMGDDFINKIKLEHAVIDEWIRKNPEKFERAKHGYGR